MNFKSLIFASDENEKKKKPESTGKTFKSKFPSSVSADDTTPKATFTPTTSFPSATKTAPITPDNPSCGPHLDKIMDMYEKGFENLNQDGYDFYEYFRAVVKIGSDNAEMYKMAFTMAQSMEPSVTKASLISQSQFYVNEITSVHKGYKETGESKKLEMQNLKTSEESNLKQEVSELDIEIQRLKAMKSQKEAELSSIDEKYASEMTDIGCKLMANDMARDKILNSINKVVSGINANI